MHSGLKISFNKHILLPDSELGSLGAAASTYPLITIMQHQRVGGDCTEIEGYSSRSATPARPQLSSQHGRIGTDGVGRRRATSNHDGQLRARPPI